MFETYQELITLIEHFEKIIYKQNNTIARLINANAEQENIINVMMQEHID